MPLYRHVGSSHLSKGIFEMGQVRSRMFALAHTIGSMQERHPTVSEYLYRRRVNAGWSAERAATKPSQKPSQPIRVRGVLTTVAEARTKAGVGYSTYHSRLRMGWSKARAASTPNLGRGNRKRSKLPREIEYRGRRLPLNGWAKELGINYRTLRARLNRGLSLAEAIEHPFGATLPGKRPR